MNENVQISLLKSALYLGTQRESRALSDEKHCFANCTVAVVQSMQHCSTCPSGTGMQSMSSGASELEITLVSSREVVLNLWVVTPTLSQGLPKLIRNTDIYFIIDIYSKSTVISNS